MKLPYVFVFVFLMGVVCFGCSNSRESTKKSSSANSNSVSSPGMDDDVTSNAVTNVVPGSLRDRANRKRRIDVDPSATPVPPNFDKAAEDSEVAVTMNEDGSVLEIRVFKSHLQLAKVEAVRLGPKDKALKVYLRNGKILDVQTDRISNLATTTTNEILEIAGIRVPQKSADRPRIAGQK